MDYSEPLKIRSKILKSVRDISVYNFVWSIVEELTCQLFAYVEHSKQSAHARLRTSNCHCERYSWFIVIQSETRSYIVH